MHTGRKYKCIEAMFSEDKKVKLYTEGEIYTSEHTRCLTDNKGNTVSWVSSEMEKIHFVDVTEELFFNRFYNIAEGYSSKVIPGLTDSDKAYYISGFIECAKYLRDNKKQL